MYEGGCLRKRRVYRIPLLKEYEEGAGTPAAQEVAQVAQRPRCSDPATAFASGHVFCRNPPCRAPHPCFCMRAVGAVSLSEVLQLELTYVRVDDREALLFRVSRDRAGGAGLTHPLVPRSMTPNFGSRQTETRRPPTPPRRGAEGCCPYVIATVVTSTLSVSLQPRT